MDDLQKKTPTVAAEGVFASTKHLLAKESFMSSVNGSKNASFISLSEASRFLDYIGQGDKEFTFQIIPLSSDKGRHAKVLHGTLEQHAEVLSMANLSGDGIFVTINQTNGKGRKATDILKVRAVFVDLDNVPLSALESAEVPPSIIIESSPQKGHGYWLVEDCGLDDFGIMQKALARRFGGDPSVCDLPRVMRLPGFIHTKGEPFTSRIVSVNNVLPYSMVSLAVFLDEGDSAAHVEEAGNSPLPDLSNIYVASLNQSYGDGERTRALTHLAGKMISDGLNNDEVFEKLMVWNDKNKPPLKLQILDRTIASLRKTHERNHPETVNIIAEMNKKYAVVLFGSKSVVVFEDDDGEAKFLAPTDFDHQLANQTLPDGKPISKYWRTHKDRRTYTGVTFDPSNKAPSHLYNQWNGFAVMPRKGDCSFFLNHVREIICGNDSELYEYVMDWMADIVQNPAKLLGVALVLKGGQGTGKGVFVEYFGRICGHHFQRVSNLEHIIGRFSGNLSKALLVFADEAFCSRDKSKIGALKTLITESRRTVEPKFKDALEVPNYVRLIMASNEDWVVPAEFDERRFCVLEVSDSRRGDDIYFKAVVQERDSGGVEALLEHLLNRNLTDKNLRVFPTTGALIAQKLKNLRSHEQWLYDLLQLGEIYGIPLTEGIAKSNLYNHYMEHCHRAKLRHVEDIGAFFKALYMILPSVRASRVRVDNHQKRHISFPPLEKCRAEFEKWIGGKVEWIS